MNEDEDEPEPQMVAVEQDPSGRYSRAFDESDGIEVAWNQVKVNDLVSSPSERERLFAEIRVLKQLKHKNIMSFFDSWLDQKNLTVNFITELFTSGTLRQYRKKHKHTDEQVLKRWAWQILQGLVYLHAHDPPIIHRGTPEFMAPELYEEKYTEKVDVYSFGMCLLELATMEYPYAECRNAAQIYKKVTSGVHPAGILTVEHVELRDFIVLCINHDPDKRPEARQLLKSSYFDSIRTGKLSCPGVDRGIVERYTDEDGSCAANSMTQGSIATRFSPPAPGSEASCAPSEDEQHEARGGPAGPANGNAASTASHAIPEHAGARRQSQDRVAVPRQGLPPPGLAPLQLGSTQYLQGAPSRSSTPPPPPLEPSVSPLGWQSQEGCSHLDSAAHQGPGAAAGPVSGRVSPSLTTPSPAASSQLSQSEVGLQNQPPLSCRSTQLPQTWQGQEQGEGQPQQHYQHHAHHHCQHQQAGHEAGQGHHGVHGSREFAVQCKRMEESKYSFQLKLLEEDGNAKNIEFAFDVSEDTPECIASEMMEDLSLSAVEAKLIAAKIKLELERAAALQQQAQSVSTPERSPSPSPGLDLGPGPGPVTSALSPRKQPLPQPPLQTATSNGTSTEAGRDSRSQVALGCSPQAQLPCAQPSAVPASPTSTKPALQHTSSARRMSNEVVAGIAKLAGQALGKLSTQLSASTPHLAATHSSPAPSLANGGGGAGGGGRSGNRSGAHTPPSEFTMSGKQPSIHDLIAAMKEVHEEERLVKSNLVVPGGAGGQGVEQGAVRGQGQGAALVRMSTGPRSPAASQPMATTSLFEQAFVGHYDAAVEQLPRNGYKQ
ncbi:hypothetical protein QJQ45_000094 [Haematococcus lacustris]|nr:hypothetical protein QJQ45_000094 [Haematococcus lacustris]